MKVLLNYHHLLYFRTIAQEGSVSGAARVLNLGQPALSSQLKQLEEYFSETLFERKNRKMLLTEAGKVALAYAEEIFGLGAELEEVMRGRPFSRRPHLRMGSLDSIPKQLIIYALEFVRNRFDSQFTLIDDRGDELLAQLLGHKIDIFISNHSPADAKTVYSRRLARQPIYIFGAKKFLGLRKNFPRSLAEQELILPTPDSKLFHDVEYYLERNKIPYKIAAYGQDTAVQKRLAGRGYGLTPQPMFSNGEGFGADGLEPIGRLDGVYEDFYLVTTKRRTQNPLIDALMKDFKLN